VEDHRLSNPFDVKTSPAGKLSALPGSQVLLLGVSWDSNSSFHVADQLSGCSASTREGCPWLDADGNKVWQEFDSCTMASDELLEEVGTAFEEDQKGHVQIGKVGSATCRLFSCADCINFAADYYRKKGISI
jgi:aminoglycoside 3-N-acetyltransferase